MQGVHYVLHAPQGDTYADLLFTMIERRSKRPPVTWTTFQARDLGGDTAELFMEAARDAYARFKPEAMLVGASCTAELIQDDPGGLAKTLGLPVPVVPLELCAPLPARRKPARRAIQPAHRVAIFWVRQRLAFGIAMMLRKSPSCCAAWALTLWSRRRWVPRLLI
jgi:hypothetical protein